MPNVNYQKFKSLLEKGKPRQDFFVQNDYKIEAAYCYILSGDFAIAQKFLSEIDNSRATWAGGLIEYIQAQGKYIPSYFQLRNFLEIDLQLLLNSKKIDYIENLLSYVDYFSTINLECYKSVGRFLLNNNYDKLAVLFFEKAKNAFFKDPELHIMLAQYYLVNNDLKSAKKEVEETLIIMPNYFPAQKLELALSKL